MIREGTRFSHLGRLLLVAHKLWSERLERPAWVRSPCAWLSVASVALWSTPWLCIGSEGCVRARLLCVQGQSWPCIPDLVAAWQEVLSGSCLELCCLLPLVHLAAARFVEFSKLRIRLEDHLQGGLVVGALATVVGKLIVGVMASPQVSN